MSDVAIAARPPPWIHDACATFTRIVGPDAPLDVDAFTRALGVGDAQIARRLFDLIDTDGSGSISLDEHCAAAERIASMDAEERSAFAFALHDLDGSGSISTSELRAILHEAVRELGVRCTDVAQSVVLGVWTSLNLFLFVQAFVAYGSKGLFVQLARGAGACLNFNGALILLPMMRALLTRLRRTGVARWSPLDDAVGFHRLVGLTMFGFAALHTVAHLLNHAAARRPFADQLLLTAAGLTGLVLMVVFTAMWATSLKVVRRSGRFELIHAKQSRDLITGLKTRTRAGRPDWAVELDRVRAAHPDERVDVFSCGPDALARALEKEALQRGFTFRKEHF